MTLLDASRGQLDPRDAPLDLRAASSPPSLEPGAPRTATASMTQAVLFERALDEVTLPVASLLAGLAMRAWPRDEDEDFRLREGALHALLHRTMEARRRSLRITRTSRGRGDVGEWAVHVEDGRWSGVSCVAIRSFAPFDASCGCADFATSRLGACEHVLAVVLARSKGRKSAWEPCRERAAGPDVAFDGLPHAKAPDDALAALRVRTVEDDEHLAQLDALVRARRRGRDTATRASRLGRDAAVLRAVLERHARRELTLDPGAVTLLSNALAETRRIVACGRERGSAEASLASLRRGLYPYQREAVARFLERGRLLLADDMGLGKTTQASACCHVMLASGRLSRVLLVVPAALKPQWRREWMATSHEPITLVDGSPADREKLYRETRRGVLVVGYEQLRIDLPLVLGFAPELVVLDEAQRIKNPTTQTAAAVRALSPAYRIALTGTPIENRLSELVSLLSFVDPDALGPVWRATAHYTYERGDAAEGKRGVHRLQELRARLSRVLVRRLRRDVIGHLPMRTDIRRPVRLTPRQRVDHEQLEVRIAALLRKTEDRPLTHEEEQMLLRWFAELRIVCNGLAQRDFETRWPELEAEGAHDALLDELDTPKLAELREVVRELCVVQGRKIVVFSAWRRMLRLAEWAVRDVLAEVGLRSAFFTGKEGRRLRERSLAELHDDPSMAVLFLTDAGGVGLNLQHAASACVLLEPPWNPAVLEQRVSRIHRPGQTQPVDVIHLVTEHSFETHLEALISNKRALAHEILDGGAETLPLGRTVLSALRTRMAEPPSDEGEADRPCQVDASSESAPSTSDDALEFSSDVTSAEPPAARSPSSLALPGLERRSDGRFNVIVSADQAAQLASLFAELSRTCTSLAAASPPPLRCAA